MTQNLLGDFQTLVWVEKYRPNKVSDCILPDVIKTQFESFVKLGDFPNLLLSGSAGTGKTTIAKALLNELDFEYILINASEQRNIDTIRTTIKEFASTISFEGKRKAIILDESDGMNSQAAQPALRAVIEEFSNVRFILTANYKNKLIEPIHSRTTTIEFTYKSDDKRPMMMNLGKRFANILKQENVEFDPKCLMEIIKKYFPDNRRILNELQRYGAGGVLNEETIRFSNTDNYTELADSIVKKDFASCRKWAAENSDTDSAQFFRGCYDALYDKVSDEFKPHLTIIIAEYQYKSAFVADHELNMSAMFAEIMGNM